MRWDVFCTYGIALWYVATVDNEIDLVAVFNDHVAEYRRRGDHAPHLYAVPAGLFRDKQFVTDLIDHPKSFQVTGKPRAATVSSMDATRDH